MDKKKLIITIAIIIIILVLSIILIKVNNFKVFNKENNTSSSQSSELANFKNAKNALENSLEVSNSLYEDDEDFYTYFKTDFINSYLQGYDLIFVDDINLVNFGICEIYGIDGKKIEKFPYEKVEKVSKDNLVIEPDQDCIIKIYSSSEETAYYFILNISKTGKYKITDICYTVGEIIDMNSEMEYQTSSMPDIQ